jgi:hypothetical protein
MRVLLAVVPVLAVLFAARPSDACSRIYVDLFTQYEKATTVVTGTSGPSRGAFLPIAIEATHKGTAPADLAFDVRRKCGANLLPKWRVIAFVDGKSWIFDFVKRTDAIASAIEQWIALRDGGSEARIEVLESLRASKDPTVAKAARHRLQIEKRTQPAK